MTRLLVVSHTVSPPLAELVDIVVVSAKNAAAEIGVDLDLRTRPALTGSALDVLEADGIIFGTPVNIGYMSGALKHFFDQIYYPCMNETTSLPYGYFLHGNNDAAGAVAAIDTIVGALKWRRVGAPLQVTAGITPTGRQELTDLTSRVVAAAAGL